MLHLRHLLLFALLVQSLGTRAQDNPKDSYVKAVTHGAGLVPGQDAGLSEAEQRFRAEIEQRKEDMLRTASPVTHPALLTQEDLAQARKNLEQLDWAQQLLNGQVAVADYILAQPQGWIEAMIPKESPGNSYGFTCPHCVGEKSQEATGSGLFSWSYRDPEKITCRACGQSYPDPAYPETAVLQMPRMGETASYYLNDAERAQPEDRSGKLAYHWVGYPMHLSFTGIIREQKIGFMREAARFLGMSYAFTGKPEYALAARDILLRFAQCYRHWLYRDYWDTYADCDPMYAAWHDKDLPIYWKRHLTERAYEEDTLEKAGMLQTYWGAGRMHPSTDNVSTLGSFALAYDLTFNATGAAGASIWTDEQRRLVEKDLLLEYIMGAEPYIGGPGKADNKNNKSPRIYRAMAEIAKVLGLPNYADVALRGYERVRDESFLYDGYSTESPSYTNMYLDELVMIPDILHGFDMPGTEGRPGYRVNYFQTDQKLKHMFRDLLWTLLPDGSFIPLSDTHVGQKISLQISLIGVRRYPELFGGLLSRLYSSPASEYAWFYLSPGQLTEDKPLRLPETLAPAWQTAILRGGEGPNAATVALPFNPEGGHRHQDNLSLFYAQGVKTLLGDLGYVGDMPLNTWIRSTFSHNLVVVDDQEQQFEGRDPEFNFMATSPLVSVVEASSNAYKQCSAYRRCVALVKLPEGQTLVVDIFRVRGGSKHAFRLYSELGASDAPGNRIDFEGLDLPEEAPLPQVGTSLAKEDIFGLRDIRSAKPGTEPWRATWRDDTGAYRLWMLSPCDRVEASNGPGQRARDDAGRRVRYVDAVREGENLDSTFVAVHEPAQADGSFIVQQVEALEVASPGSALKLSTLDQTYFLFSDIAQPVQVGEVKFVGTFGFVSGAGAYCAVGAELLEIKGTPVDCGPPAIVKEALRSDDRLIATVDPPAPAPYLQAQAYVRVQTEDGWTGLPVREVEESLISVRDYPAPALNRVELAGVLFGKVE